LTKQYNYLNKNFNLKFNERSIRGIVSERKGKQEIQKDKEQTSILFLI